MALIRQLIIRITYVYILTTINNKVLYTGVTNDLSRRCFEHKQGKIKGFTQKYNVKKLVYYEMFNDIEIAIAREKQIKAFSRIKKENLINAFNPAWTELYINGVVNKPINQKC